MELKSLLLGMFFTIGIFAVKSGVGLNYAMSKRKGIRSKLSFAFLTSLIYLSVFAASYGILHFFELARYLTFIQKLLQTGMLIHILIAGGLIVWAIALLRKRKNESKSTLAWTMLVLPCPVCMTVIFLSSAFLISYFPDNALKAVLSAYLFFIALVLITIIIMIVIKNKTGQSPETTLGASMLFIAVYFFVSAIVMPHFNELDKVYRLAVYKGDEVSKYPVKFFILVLITGLIFFVFGFLLKRRKINRRSL